MQLVTVIVYGIQFCELIYYYYYYVCIYTSSIFYHFSRYCVRFGKFFYFSVCQQLLFGKYLEYDRLQYIFLLVLYRSTVYVNLLNLKRHPYYFPQSQPNTHLHIMALQPKRNRNNTCNRTNREHQQQGITIKPTNSNFFQENITEPQPNFSPDIITTFVSI